MSRNIINSPRVRGKVYQQLLELVCPSGADETPTRFVLRVAAGLVFLATGMMKLVSSIVLGSSVPRVPPGIPGFAEYLAAVGVPFPLIGSYAVTLVEVGGALVLLASAFWTPAARLTRLVSLALAVDMLVAIVTVGLRNLAGNPVIMQGVPVTFQAWRLPLEVGLLLTMLFFLRFPAPREAPEPEPLHLPGSARGA
jgi:putative oxidoreductase